MECRIKRYAPWNADMRFTTFVCIHKMLFRTDHGLEHMCSTDVHYVDYNQLMKYAFSIFPTEKGCLLLVRCCEITFPTELFE